MDVHKSSLLAVFDAKQRLEVPLFQRQYVWNEDQHWLPLWEDIERKFIDALEGRKNAPNHFLGAMVLDQKQTPTGHVVIRQIIDGQQRLTTFQIFLAAYRDFCKEQGSQPLANECDKFLGNTGMMANPDVDRFKVWPTQLDRPQFGDVILSASRNELLKRHPLKRRPYARRPDPRPRMVEAYLFFFERFKEFFLGEDGQSPLAAEHPIAVRLDECFQTLRNALMVVLIDLEKDDDPQVIFETLNARGEPLLPADLLKNYIFLRASREKMDVDATYEKYWSRFDDEFWRQEVKQGRLTRPRSDLFMQHFLASHQGQDIPIKHLYVEYRHWIETTRPFSDIAAEIESLARQGDDFRRIIDPKEGDIIYRLCSFLDAYDIRTAYPLLLALLDAQISDLEWLETSRILESYLLRRAVCNLGTKNYNRIFLSATRLLRKEGFTAARLKQYLLTQTGEFGVWPDDATFHRAWLDEPLYGPMNSPKLAHIFLTLNQAFMSKKNETVVIGNTLSIEHIMPREWVANWPFPDGSKGMEISEVFSATDNDPRLAATRDRNEIINTLGNLTILSSSLNTAQSNYTWAKKKPEMMKHSLLPINQDLFALDEWTEETIRNRAEGLFKRANTIWVR